MNQTSKRHIRDEWRKEARQDEEYVAQMEHSFRTWRRRTIIAAVGLTANTAVIIPFLYGHSLHDKWEAEVKTFVLIAMLLLLVSLYTAGITYSFWDWLRKTKKIHKQFSQSNAKRQE